MKFGIFFVTQRQKLNLSQEQIAQKIGVSRTYVTLIENGARLPGKKQILKIAESLQVKKHEVVNWYLEDLREKLT